MATHEEWTERYEAAYETLPDELDQACPNCGTHALRLVFTGKLSNRIGFASFWCDACLEGIGVSNVMMPPGAVVRSSEIAPEDRRPVIPSYTTVS